MTVSSSTRRAGPFNGNGVTTEFPFTFKVFAKSDVAVYLTDPDGVQTLLSDGYKVTLSADQNASPGGVVTYPFPLPALPPREMQSGYSLAIIGNVPYTQGTDLTNTGRYLPQVIENALDKVTILIQQMIERLGRTVSFPVGDTTTATLPRAGERAGNFLAFDAEGRPIAAAGVPEVPVSAFMATVLDSVDAGAARVAIGVGAATEAGAGLTEYATVEEVQTGTSNDRAVTPYALRNGASAVGRAVFYAADAAAARAAIGVGAGTTGSAGLVELATTAETMTGVDGARAVTPSSLHASVIGGLGQVWVNMTASRAVNTTYTNTSGRPIQVAIRVASAASQLWTLTIGGEPVSSYSASGINGTFFAVIPPNATYVLAGGVTINSWCELR